MRPYFEDAGITIYHADCREILPLLAPVDVVIADPPYGVTSLVWDRRVEGWLDLVPARNVWCFGSLRFFMNAAKQFSTWTYAQEIVWEKHNGSMFHADRFRRVHEFAVQFYKGAWADIWKRAVTTPDATKRTLRRKTRPAHSGHIENGAYASDDGGPRLQRSVIYARSEHGTAVHPTQKPVEIIEPLLEYSCPPEGVALDPMMGSGTTLIAAMRLHRRAIGIEVDERFCALAAERVRTFASQAVLL